MAFLTAPALKVFPDLFSVKRDSKNPFSHVFFTRDQRVHASQRLLAMFGCSAACSARRTAWKGINGFVVLTRQPDGRTFASFSSGNLRRLSFPLLTALNLFSTKTFTEVLEGTDAKNSAAIQKMDFSRAAAAATTLSPAVSSHGGNKPPPSLSKPQRTEFVHPSLRFTQTNDKFIFGPEGGVSDGERLVIDRVTGACELDATGKYRGVEAGNEQNTRIIYGIMGRIKLIGGWYLIVITRRQLVGQIDGHDIWRVVQTEMVPYARSTIHLGDEQIRENELYISMVRSVLATDYHYFATSYDITHTCQRLHFSDVNEFMSQPMWLRADQRFLWNRFVLLNLAASSTSSDVQAKMGRYMMPVVHGFMSIKPLNVNNYRASYALLSRRSVQRAGTRLHVRGVDDKGYVANFVETETIFEVSPSASFTTSDSDIAVNSEGDIYSYVQTRGSIPLYWSQKPNLRYKPTYTLSTRHDQQQAFAKHFTDQIQVYGRQTVLNLINQKGGEGRLGKELERVFGVAHNPLINLVAFDFHAEVGQMRWDKLSNLMNKIMPERQRHGWFARRKNSKPGEQPSRWQTGVFRTNCIDCLDRTNVVQSLIARLVLDDQLTFCGILKKGESVANMPTAIYTFRHMWADNADLMSLQYSGTNALKTDFSRTGKRSYKGALWDGYYSVMRYIRNNFNDGFRQDSIDLFLGNYAIGEDAPTLGTVATAAWRRFLPLFGLFSGAMLVITVIIPADLNSTHRLGWLGFWMLSCVAVLTWIVKYGADHFVDSPRFLATLHREADFARYRIVTDVPTHEKQHATEKTKTVESGTS